MTDEDKKATIVTSTIKCRITATRDTPGLSTTITRVIRWRVGQNVVLNPTQHDLFNITFLRKYIVSTERYAAKEGKNW
ncbi:hypothetical protein VPNG_08216 [Cytospora leucostoma]|uniref:Uncharacterized protein n=1 Tax=Cytospora leucostoma TaxID=1230097 RepID=A0A423W748_9PEZI|nr:hypothetical protein VPNG_08216 [Cytospora leucostoma]